MTITTLTWTRYDGTPETLPPFDTEVLVYLDGDINVRTMVLDIGGWRGKADGLVLLGPSIGDLWAPWPEAPEAK